MPSIYVRFYHVDAESQIIIITIIAFGAVVVVVVVAFSRQRRILGGPCS